MAVRKNPPEVTPVIGQVSEDLRNDIIGQLVELAAIARKGSRILHFRPALCREQWSRLVGDGAERSRILAVDELEIPLLFGRERMGALTASPIVAAGKRWVNWDRSEYVNERSASGVLLGTSVLTTRIRSCAP